MAHRKLRCPTCTSDRLVKAARQKVQVRGGEEVRQRYFCNQCGRHTTVPKGAPPEPQVFRETPGQARRYVFTSAQNATKIHPAFLKSLQVYAEETGAELAVIRTRYKNPTSQWTESQANAERWDKRLEPYIFSGRFDLNANLTILGDIKTQLTAVHPTTGFEAITGAKSAILGHPKIELRTVATPSHKLPKIVTTTGSVTVPNYTDSRAGKRGYFHHSFGAVVVEVVNGEIFHARHINATKNGHFQDLRTIYTPKGTKPGPPLEALVMGDTHRDFIDPEVVLATFTDPGSMVNFLQPKRLIWHDLVDMWACNPHTEKDPYLRHASQEAQRNTILEEMQRAAEFVDSHSPDEVENVIVSSNHHDFLHRYMKSADWRHDLPNAEFYLETALEMVRGCNLTEEGLDRLDPFTHWMRRLMGHPRVTFPDERGSYMVKGIECGMHGHLGPNGARGTLQNLARIGVKSMTGHEHSPGIDEGHYRVGTSSRLQLDYTRGPSSWLQTHGGIYANGKRVLFNIIDGGWRLEE